MIINKVYFFISFEITSGNRQLIKSGFQVVQKIKLRTLVLIINGFVRDYCALFAQCAIL